MTGSHIKHRHKVPLAGLQVVVWALFIGGCGTHEQAGSPPKVQEYNYNKTEVSDSLKNVDTLSISFAGDFTKSLDIHLVTGVVELVERNSGMISVPENKVSCLPSEKLSQLKFIATHPVCRFQHRSLMACPNIYVTGYANFKAGNQSLYDIGGGNECSFIDFCDAELAQDLESLVNEIKIEHDRYGTSCLSIAP